MQHLRLQLGGNQPQFSLQTIIVSSEFEALVLENALIKQYMPHYNILLKDDKAYPFVRLSRESYPKFSRPLLC